MEQQDPALIFTQVTNMHIYCTCITVIIISPNMLNNFSRLKTRPGWLAIRLSKANSLLVKSTSLSRTRTLCWKRSISKSCKRITRIPAGSAGWDRHGVKIALIRAAIPWIKRFCHIIIGASSKPRILSIIAACS